MTTPAEVKEKVDTMIKDLRHGKAIYEQFAQATQDRMQISGKTMNDWRTYFHVKIPENPDITACKNIDMKLMELYQEASFLKAMAEAALILNKKGYESQYRTKFEALVAEYQKKGLKIPAKETLENLAKCSVDDVETGLSYSELAVRFWKEILDNLNFMRKIIENATINNSVEAKMTEKGF